MAEPGAGVGSEVGGAAAHLTEGDRQQEALRRMARRRRRLLSSVGRFGTIIGLVALCAYFSIATDAFLTKENLLTILDSSALLGIIASGLTVTLVMFDFDLSIGYTATLAGMYSAGVAVNHGTTWGIAAGLFAGLVVGMANGAVVTMFNVSAFIATLGMGTIIQGVIFGYREGAQISFGLPENFTAIGTGDFIGVSYLIWIMGGVMVVLWLMLQHTRLGRQMYAVGGNPVAARLSGIHLGRTRFIAFMIAGLSSGLAGVLLASNLGTGNPTAGIGYLLDAFTACFIGAATLRDGEFHIGGTLVGVLILGVLTNGLVLVGVAPDWQTISKGGVLIAAVAIAGVMRKSALR